MKLNKPRCQCIESCKQVPLPGSCFCKNHVNFCPRVAPLNGYEPDYEPDRWNSLDEVRKSLNCYMYAMNIQDPSQIKKCRFC